MKRFAIFCSLIFCTAFLMGQSLVASTVMVTVSAHLNNGTISPKSMDRVQQMVLDIEDSALGEAFNAGHIAFNIPASVQLAADKAKFPTLSALATTAKEGGAEYLIVCNTECSELDTDAPLVVSSCFIKVYSVTDSFHPQFEKTIKVNTTTRDTDLKALVSAPFQEIVGKL